jgi:hypothetical protein
LSSIYPTGQNIPKSKTREPKNEEIGLLQLRHGKTYVAFKPEEDQTFLSINTLQVKVQIVFYSAYSIVIIQGMKCTNPMLNSQDPNFWSLTYLLKRVTFS